MISVSQLLALIASGAVTGCGALHIVLSEADAHLGVTWGRGAHSDKKSFRPSPLGVIARHTSLRLLDALGHFLDAF